MYKCTVDNDFITSICRPKSNSSQKNLKNITGIKGGRLHLNISATCIRIYDGNLYSSLPNASRIQMLNKVLMEFKATILL